MSVGASAWPLLQLQRPACSLACLEPSELLLTEGREPGPQFPGGGGAGAARGGIFASNVHSVPTPVLTILQMFPSLRGSHSVPLREMLLGFALYRWGNRLRGSDWPRITEGRVAGPRLSPGPVDANLPALMPTQECAYSGFK